VIEDEVYCRRILLHTTSPVVGREILRVLFAKGILFVLIVVGHLGCSSCRETDLSVGGSVPSRGILEPALLFPKVATARTTVDILVRVRVGILTSHCRHVGGSYQRQCFDVIQGWIDGLTLATGVRRLQPLASSASIDIRARVFIVIRVDL